MFGAAVAELFNGAIEYRLRPGSASTVAIIDQIVQHRHKRVNMNVLGWLWRTKGCDKKSITVGPIYVGGSGGGGGDFSGGFPQRVCREERWYISFNGGTTWQGVWVTVCEYVFTQ